MRIQNPKGKYYGELDVLTYVLTTRDGRNVRQTPIPKEGCRLKYTAGDSPTEVITIPSQQLLLKKAV